MKKKIKKIHYPQELLLLGELKKNIIQEFSLVLSIVISYSSPVTKMHSNSISIHNITVTSLTSKFFIRTHFVVKQLFIVTKQLGPFKNL